MNKTIDYALKIDPSLARFSVSTPFPGTKFYNELNEKNMLLTNDFEKYSQFRLVYKHDNLSPHEIQMAVGNALARFYFRPSFILRHLKRTLSHKLNFIS